MRISELRPRHAGLSLFVLSLGIHAAISLSIPAPTVFEDEYVVMGLARMLARIGPEPILNKYYPGLSILLTPIYWITDDQQIAFRMAQLLNTLLIAAIAPLSFYIFRCLAPKIRIRYALLVGVLAMLYPAFLLTHTVIWSEALAVVAILGLGALITRTWQRPTPGRLLVLGCLSGLIVLTHQRAVAAPFALIVVLVYLAIGHKVRYAQVAWTSAGITVGGLLSLGALWISSVPVIRPSMLANLDTASRSAMQQVLNIGSQLAGQSFYLLASTGGLVAIAIVGAVSSRAQTADSARIGNTIMSSFFIIGALVTLLESAVFLRNGDTRADLAIYGRYVELFAVPLVVLGIAQLWNRTDHQWTQSRLLATTALPIVVSGFVTILVRGAVIDDLPVNLVNIVALSPASVLRPLDLRIALIIGIVLALVVSIWMSRKQTWIKATVAISIMWVLAFFVAYVPNRTFSDLAAERTVIPATIIEIEDSTRTSVDCVAYAGVINPWVFYHYAWNLAPRTLAPFEDGTCSAFLITADDTVVPEGSELLATDTSLPEGIHRLLWKLPEAK